MKIKTYTGFINKLKKNQIFVFGSNTQGRHGKGTALIALKNFGAKYGQARGLQGQSYAIVTKDLTKYKHPSRTVSQIAEEIGNLYQFAKSNLDKEFLIAYSNSNNNLNGYTSKQLLNIFLMFDVPENIIFREDFLKLAES